MGATALRFGLGTTNAAAVEPENVSGDRWMDWEVR